MSLGKFSKADWKELCDQRDRLRVLVDNLKDNIENEEVIADAGAFAARVAAINGNLSEANATADQLSEYVTGLRDTQQDLYAEKSERWQESDRAAEISTWLDDIGGACDETFSVWLDVEETGSPRAYPAKLAFRDLLVDLSPLTDFLDTVDGLTQAAGA